MSQLIRSLEEVCDFTGIIIYLGCVSQEIAHVGCGISANQIDLAHSQSRTYSYLLLLPIGGGAVNATGTSAQLLLSLCE